MSPFVQKHAQKPPTKLCALRRALVGVEHKTLGAKVQFMVVMLLAKALKRLGAVVFLGSQPPSGLVFRFGAWAIV